MRKIFFCMFLLVMFCTRVAAGQLTNGNQHGAEKDPVPTFLLEFYKNCVFGKAFTKDNVEKMKPYVSADCIKQIGKILEDGNDNPFTGSVSFDVKQLEEFHFIHILDDWYAFRYAMKGNADKPMTIIPVRVKNKNGKINITKVTLRWDSTITPENTYLFKKPEKMPEMPGGAKAFLKEIGKFVDVLYPLVKDQTPGICIISFVVKKDGELCNFKIERGGTPEQQEIVKCILKMTPAWKPGEDGGKKINMKMSFPFNFKLPLSPMPPLR